jgi:ABC-type dipeptide/oligopeptide/nickel transport system permease component
MSAGALNHSAVQSSVYCSGHPRGGRLAYSGRVSDSGPITDNRAERVLAYMFAAIVALSIICFFAVMIGTFSGVTREEMGSGIWAVVTMLPWFGLPVAFVLLIALLIVNGVRRGRAARTGSS